MQRYFIYLSYDGTAYHGWQVQPNARSVQAELQGALSILLRRPTEIVGAGRTDTGVHASLMVAHFEVDEALDAPWLADKLNRILPQDISVQCVRPVTPDAHARFSATARTYHYYICTCKDVFHRQYCWRPFVKLDFELMNEAAAMLPDFSDFTSFSKLHTDTKTNLCCIEKAFWTQTDENVWRFEITANRFLRNMVRAIVGTLVEVGRGKLSMADFRAVIERKDRCAAGESVAANALFLVDIKYPENLFLE